MYRGMKVTQCFGHKVKEQVYFKDTLPFFSKTIREIMELRI